MLIKALFVLELRLASFTSSVITIMAIKIMRSQSGISFKIFLTDVALITIMTFHVYISSFIRREELGSNILLIINFLKIVCVIFEVFLINRSLAVSTFVLTMEQKKIIKNGLKKNTTQCCNFTKYFIFKIFVK